MKKNAIVAIIDYGSQLTQLIARRVREAGVYSEIYPCDITVDKLKQIDPDAIILSGSPASVSDANPPSLDPAIFQLKKPLLGICYGMQLLANTLGGKISHSETCEYGPALLHIYTQSPLWRDLDHKLPLSVWMSHGDSVTALPDGFETIGSTDQVKFAAMADDARKIYGIQFHPEVHHTPDGMRILANFLFHIAHIAPDWNMRSFVQQAIENMREQIGDGHVICALSGGIDSTVVAVLLNKAIGNRLHCVFVDNGLLRLEEANQVIDALKTHFKLDLIHVNAAHIFLDRLKNVDDPEQKRKIIGAAFIEIFDAEAKKLPQIDFLAQGTLYPDVIESVSSKGPSAVIKSHHNVGGLPDKMNLKLIEPLRELFKDEVRKVAIELGIPEEFVWRQPFPGPGLAIRVLGHVDERRLHILRQADYIVQQEMAAADMTKKVWQCFAILLPLRTVGVMGDSRTYENVIAIRCVDSIDAMTADWTRLPWELLARMSTRIINEVSGVNRVVYDISSKPPSTIEWE